MNRHAVFANESEHQQIVAALSVAQTTPVIALISAHAMRGGFAGDAWESLHKLVHRIAMEHGLPEIEGYYGYDPGNKEFVSV